MKKSMLFGLICLLLAGSTAWGQASLPAFYSGPWKDATLPTGWTAYGLRSKGDYSENFDGIDGNAGGLDGSGDYVEINVAGAPSTVSYYIKVFGAFGSGSVFKIRESANGSTWTDVTVYDSGNPVPGSATQYEDDLLSSTRYVQLIYITKDTETWDLTVFLLKAPDCPVWRLILPGIRACR